jgi:membrane carboxypeptidase/penicillin-binding protein PbpC
MNDQANNTHRQFMFRWDRRCVVKLQYIEKHEAFLTERTYRITLVLSTHEMSLWDMAKIYFYRDWGQKKPHE